MGYRILIADDDLHTRRILETLLAREPALAGPEVVGVSDGKDALAAFEKQSFDLVITDLLMPRLDGFALARALRANPMGKSVPLLITSAIYKDRAALGKLEQEANCEFFAKPFQMRDLIRAVLRLLVEPSRPRVAGRTPAKGTPRVDLVPQSGSLSDKNPAYLLLELFDSSSTGVLTLTRAKVRKDIYILLGHPIGAESNLRNETLGQILLARGALAPAQLQEALELARDGNHRLGAILVERGWVKEADVLKLLGIQVRMRIAGALRWREGTWSFTPGDTFSGRMTNLSVDTPQLVFATLKSSTVADEVARAAAEASTRKPPLGPPRLVIGLRFERHRDAFLRIFGSDGLKVLRAGPRPGDLAARNDVSLLEQYDALLASGLASLQAEPEAPPTKNSDGVPTAPMDKEPSGRVVSRGDALFGELFGELDGNSARPPTLDLANPTDDSGLFPMPPPPRPKREATDPNVAAARDALLREYLSVPGRDHYEVLHVERTASEAEIKKAFERRAHEFEPERFQAVDLGPDHAKLKALNEVVRQAYETLSVPPRRVEYDKALATKAPPDNVAAHAPRPQARPVNGAAVPVPIDGELDFRDGLRMLGSDRPAEAVARLAGAVKAAPEQADYHALFAWAQFQAASADSRGAAAAAAWRSLEQAFAIDPDNVAAHEFAGRIAFSLGEDVRTAKHLERALQLDPGRAEALSTLEAVYLRRGEHERLVKLYRSLIERLGSARAGVMWFALATLLRDQLDDREGARTALETYLGLVPDDARARDALRTLQTQAPRKSSTNKDSKRAETTLRAAWRAAPHDATPGRQLFRLHLEAGEPDSALAVALALVARDAADDEVQAFARRYRPRFLQRAIAPVAWAHVDAVRHPDDDRDLATLYTRLFAAVRPKLPTLEERWAGQARLGLEVLPPTFVGVLGYATWMLGVAPPGLVRNLNAVEVPSNPPAAPPTTPVAASPTDAAPSTTALQLVPLDPPLLAATPAVLGLTDKIALAFRLGRALAGLYPARAFAMTLPSRQLKVYLGAAMALDAGMSTALLEDEVVRLREKLVAVPMLAQDVRPLVERIAARGTTLNLSRWVRGISRTAERVGLLVSNDLPTAARILNEEGAHAAAIDLVDFSLSEDLARVRAALGLTVAV